MDDNREIQDEEIRTTADQPPLGDEETDVVAEAEQEPARQVAESADGERAVFDLIENLVEYASPEEATAQPAVEEQTSGSETNEAPAADETTAHAGESRPEPVPEADETLVEMLDDAGEQGEVPAEEVVQAGTETQESPPDNGETVEADESPTVESVLEAILFATDEPLPESKLAGIVETTAKQVRESIENLNARYEANHNAFRIEQIAGGYQMLTQPIYNSWLKKMLRVRSDNKLSPAAMETLAIIAYKQPIIRADIEAIRGVAVGEVIRSLMYKGLVKIAGRAEILGRPMLYGTTKKFLEIFGLNSLKDLPKAEDLKNPDRG